MKFVFSHRYVSKHLSLIAVIVIFISVTPGGRTQYPYYPYTGPMQTPTLRDAAAATYTQAGIVIKGADDWSRRAGWATYRAEHFQQDFANAQLQFLTLRQQFNVAAGLARGLNRSRANNAVAELDAGLNIIGELFPFLQNEFSAGTLDHKTIVRTCRALEDAMKEWQRELRKNGSRIGLIW